MRFMILLMSLVFWIVPTAAQDNWVVEERCMSSLTYPIIRQGNWDFPGIIISSVYPDGIHAIRADQNLEYYLALESDVSFPAAGNISPDGQYFAYPIGTTTYHVNTLGDDILSVDYVRVVPTDGNTDESYQFEAYDFTYSGGGRSLNLESVQWFGPDIVSYESGRTEGIQFNLQSDPIPEWLQSAQLTSLELISPDGTRAFTEDTLYDVENDTSLTYPTPRTIAWLPDSTAFVTATEPTIEIVDRDGNVIETIEQPDTIHIAVAPDGNSFAFWNNQQELFLADIAQRTVHDLCFEGNLGAVNITTYIYPNLAWSPDSQSLAFSYDNYLVILDTETLENKVIDHESGQVMAWAPL